MMLRIYILTLLLCSIHLKIFSNEGDKTVEQIFTQIYNQQFGEAEKALITNQNEIDSFYFQILNLDLYWWKYSLSRKKTDAQILQEVLDNFTLTNHNSQKEKINELIRLSYQMRYEIKRYNFIGAAIVRSKVRKQIEVLKPERINLGEKEQKIFDLYLTLFQYSDNVINPFSIESKTNELANSLLLLEKFTKEDDLILNTLARYFLGRIYIKVEKDFEKGQAYFKLMENQFPKNQLFRDIANGTNTKF